MYIGFNSQLPDFLGGTCSCPNPGGCLRSNKGPWNDPELMKVWSLSVEIIFITCFCVIIRRQTFLTFSYQIPLQLVLALHGEALYPRRITSFSDSDIEIKPVSPQVLQWLSYTVLCLSSYLRDASCLRPVFSAQLLRDEIGSAETEMEVGVSAYSIIQSKPLSDKVSNKILFAPYQLLIHVYAKLRTSMFEFSLFPKLFRHHL